MDTRKKIFLTLFGQFFGRAAARRYQTTKWATFPDRCSELSAMYTSSCGEPDQNVVIVSLIQQIGVWKERKMRICFRWLTSGSDARESIERVTEGQRIPGQGRKLIIWQSFWSFWAAGRLVGEVTSNWDLSVEGVTAGPRQEAPQMQLMIFGSLDLQLFLILYLLWSWSVASRGAGDLTTGS